ncbi:MAG TPA: Sb-PDE family phosphodiesterase [Vicinamibacteria bacterium]|nr:Sb-PDE family phosphodiesterase [Vicinamibacteria bacterium]
MVRQFKVLVLVLASWSFSSASRAEAQERGSRRITFPNVPDYLTLKCDLHQHSVFSDGSVWPDIRVEEAVKDGLDAISLTEHLEYQPHREDIPHEDRNRSYELARELARDHDLLVVHGSEITRDMPPGHANAIFIRDANTILQEDAMGAFREAHSQGAFIFWNHPDWVEQAPDGIARLTPLHRQLIDERLLHGIEVVNEQTISEEAFQIALDEGLTVLGTSDIHGLVDWEFDVPGGGHRPITLVFAKERTSEAIREALFAGRTVVWYRNQLIGLPEFVEPLLLASIVVRGARYLEDSKVVEVTIENLSDASFSLRNLGDVSFQRSTDIVTLAPHEETTLGVKGASLGERLELRFEVENALVAPRKHPEIRLETWFDAEVLR